MVLKNDLKVILDVDVGTDDAYALMFLLDAEKKKLLKIEAIVCSAGNASVENVCKNVLRLLQIFGRTEIPIFKGAQNSIIPLKESIEYFHGNDGFGDLEHEEDLDLNIIKKEPAIVGIHDIIAKNPHEISLICLGPLTNAALAITVYDDFIELIKDIFIMGGNIYGFGNITDAAEFNFYMDPESAYIVLNKFKKPITILPWEACKDSTISKEWRFEVLGKCNNLFIELMNRAESKIYKNLLPIDPWYPCDLLLVICMLHPEVILQQSKLYANVELRGENTRGQMVIQRFRQQSSGNANIFEKINFDLVKKILLDIIKEL